MTSRCVFSANRTLAAVKVIFGSEIKPHGNEESAGRLGLGLKPETHNHNSAATQQRAGVLINMLSGPEPEPPTNLNPFNNFTSPLLSCCNLLLSCWSNELLFYKC